MKYVLARRLLPLAVIAAAVLGGGGIAGALIPDSNGTVHGCIKINTGGLYLIDPSAGQGCGKDSALDWNETGATGTQGPQGLQGLPGNQGAAGSSGYEKQFDQESTDTSGDGTAEADCSSGKVAIAGGYASDTGLTTLKSAPTSDGAGWTVSVTGSPSALFTAYAICATNGGS